MTLEVFTKRKRGRPLGGRAFDHDQARRMRSEGMSYVAIARELGVTPDSIARACQKRASLRLRLAGPALPCTDERWRELEAWIERRHGHHGIARSRVETRRLIPRVSA